MRELAGQKSCGGSPERLTTNLTTTAPTTCHPVLQPKPGNASSATASRNLPVFCNQEVMAVEYSETRLLC